MTATPFLFTLAMLCEVVVIAQPTQPILQIENGMHVADVRRISTDADGKYLLTCGMDKTARLWDAATGQLLNTLRIPIGRFEEGKLFACALSPDGTLAALGGYTGVEWDKRVCIYVINTQTGRIVHRITGLPNEVAALEFSPNGQWLAAGLFLGAGVQIFNARDWEKAIKLDGYRNTVFNVAFNKNNRLATVCYDGKIRLYDNRFELIAEQENLPGKHPYCLSFNPTGSLLAVGYNDAPVVEVRSGSDLSLLYRPSIKNASEPASLHVLSFSDDGTSLYGGGRYRLLDNQGRYVKNIFRIWSNAGRGAYTETPVALGAINDIKTLPGGNIAVMGSYPDIVMLSASGKPLWHRAAATIDYDQTRKPNLRTSKSGATIWITPTNAEPVSFDINLRSPTQQVPTYPGPTDRNAGTVVSNWFNSFTPSINLHNLTLLGQYDRSFCTDVSRNGKEVIIGTEGGVYKADSSSKILWLTSLQASVYAVNISGNDKTVVAALSDGTIRWFRMADGKELLAFYLSNDEKRWVLFTPSGYYDASPGGEDMLGWHINNGPNEAPSFYPVSRFRKEFYRPDIIDAVLKTYDEGDAIILANNHSIKHVINQIDIKENRPPEITISSPLNGSTTSSELINIIYSLKTPENAPLKSLKVLVDGRPVPVAKPINSNNDRISIHIPPNDCIVTILAENDNGISSGATLYLKYKGSTNALSEVVKKPNLYVLAIGISEYQNPDYKLNYCADDANGFAAILRQLKGGLYDDVIVKPLIDKNATMENIHDGLQWIQQTKQGDLAIIFYAGHGENDKNGGFYMLPVGADEKRLRSTCLDYKELMQAVDSIKGKVLVFIDACHSGNIMGSERRDGFDINALVNKLASTSGAFIFSSCMSRESSFENSTWKHGAFTLALMEGLNGKALISGKNKITVKSLDLYISERVLELTKYRQHTTLVEMPNVPDFTIAVIEGK